nr:hypothetical protein CFP56_03015 [Quercus suber]
MELARQRLPDLMRDSIAASPVFFTSSKGQSSDSMLTRQLFCSHACCLCKVHCTAGTLTDRVRMLEATSPDT